MTHSLFWVIHKSNELGISVFTILLDKTKKGEYSCLTIRKVILLKKTRKVRQCLHHA